MTLVRRLLREPLVHFLLLGCLIFAWFEWRGGGGSESRRIVITRGQIEHLASGFARTWQRAPTDAELKGLVDDHVKEEIASREALAMGLDRDDTVVRRRLRQKLEFLAEDAMDDAAPTDAQLQEWWGAHRAEYEAESKVALTQVYRSPDRGAAVRLDAERLLERLRAGPEMDLDAVSDTTMLPRDMPLGPISEVARTFGAEFARAVDALPVAQWSGPVTSPYGLHLVRVTERVAGTEPSFAEIRPLLERDFEVERRKARIQELYDRLLQKYRVTTEPPKAATGPEAAPRARAEGP
jgi:hypothetical protein